MYVSRRFNLNLVQAELDFVDVELTRDTPLFLDPFALRTRVDEWSVRCSRAINVFFQALIHAIQDGNEDEARRLLSSLHEPNETRLGLSRGKPQGSGIGEGLAGEILDAIKKSRAVETGLLSDLSDTELFVEGIGRDRISDLTTNLLRHELIPYTIAQCDLHSIPTRAVASGPLWDVATLSWHEEYRELPVVDGKKLLLVPKAIVRWAPSLTHREYYEHFVLEFLRAQEQRRRSTGLFTPDRRVSKKEVRENNPLSKALLRTFTVEHPEVLNMYKQEKAGGAPLSAAEMEQGFDETVFARQLIIRLGQIPPGGDHAAEYHRLMIGLLEFLFYPNLIYPKKEREINEGRKRIDIAYVNYAASGLFERFTRVTRLPSLEILVECKNYTKDVGNPELDQLNGRFAPQRGWLGLLVCRTLDNPDLFVARCRDAVIAQHGYVIPLDDRNIVLMLEHIERGQRDMVFGHLDAIFRRLSA